MTAQNTHSFFIPEEFFCQQSRLLSQTYNLAHVLLKRSELDHVFVPIRSLQYLAIIENNAFWFVDSLAYAVSGNEGGRLIRVSWHPLISAGEREGLTENMDCRVIFYGEDMSDIQRRLHSEFYQSMLHNDQRYRASNPANAKISFLPIKARSLSD